MKFVKYFLVGLILLSAIGSKAQTINWASLTKQDQHIISAGIAADYSLSYGIGYGYQLKSKRAIVLNAEVSIPAGNNFFDDYKTKLGAEIKWFRFGNFSVASRTQAVFRRYSTDYARLLNIGTDISATAGYYKTKWFAAAEIGFDKAIVTHFKHTDLYKMNFPGVKDGWYEPSTGGNIYYGVQAGYSTRQFDFFLKAGKLTEQDLKTSPTLPVYARLGVNLRLQRN